MMHIALWEPEIPPNTGNIARLCAATGATLHLIGRLGFRLDDRSLRRAGLDYWPVVELERHPSMAQFEESMAGKLDRLFCASAHAQTAYSRIAFQEGDILLFGPETRGLPPEILKRYETQAFVIPMPAGKVRSINLATAVAVVLYEALRQLECW